MNSEFISWGEEKKGLRLGVMVSENDACIIHVFLQNVGDKVQKVLSHVEAPEKHYDWFKIIVFGRNNQKFNVMLQDDRNRSAQITKDLNPNDFIFHEINVCEWLSKPVNSHQAIEKGTYEMEITYHIVHENEVWTGSLRSARTRITVK